MNVDKLLNVATFAGRIMLENGAEVYRVEETIIRICTSYGATNSDSFATPTGIISSIYYNEKTISLVKRIKYRRVDLNKVHEVNDLSRRLNKETISLDELYTSLEKINQEKGYSTKTIILFSAITAGSFSFIFGGNVLDFISALIIGATIKFFAIFFEKLSINDFFINYICSAILTVIAIFLFTFNITTNIDTVIISSMMLLVPGLALTNAVRDFIAGDLLAGMTKGAEALLVAISIASGAGTILGLWINTFGGSIL